MIIIIIYCWIINTFNLCVLYNYKYKINNSVHCNLVYWLLNLFSICVCLHMCISCSICPSAIKLGARPITLYSLITIINKSFYLKKEKKNRICTAREYIWIIKQFNVYISRLKVFWSRSGLSHHCVHIVVVYIQHIYNT